MRIMNRLGNSLGDRTVDFENLVEHIFGERPDANIGWAPRVDLSESDTGFAIEMELPGIDPENVNVEIKDGCLEVWGEKEAKTGTEGVEFLRNERVSGPFRRSFEFPTQVESEKIEAEFKHGLLNIKLPKSEKVLPRKIKVKVSA